MITNARRPAIPQAARLGPLGSDIESGGPPVTPPTHRGFGTRIMENIIGGQLRGEVRFDWRDHGLTCEIALLIA
jgi:two-component sensor histidine kinase